ncbi:cyclin-like protein [Punctularia strigosozonata HHB-11173 SS5]|uniref:cyclin-like protein n=1 Tax=Punctularia strigosozonata (strain HHB-11173) TaxID=741275 RepID=UPI00044176FB|nr:cyclin-like protein [Punctularia strigosozonata HHB-11173 SS5]EIN12726.1 cyclin-like protein [Punctularia strigosozonata HHB-11173 SS5]
MEKQSHPPASHSKYHHPYFTAEEIEYLSEKQRGKLSATQEEKARQQACAFAEAIGARVGFPRKTIATAQTLYHRFHLFFPRKDFHYHDVILASLYVSTKMHDTLKKPREILMVSYAVRFPELAAKSRSIAGELDMDPATVEADRQRLLAVERLILETICFNFTSRMPFPYVIKIGKVLRAPKKLTKLTWRLAVDCHRTLMPLRYPPHVIALGSFYTAALLSSFERAPSDFVAEATRIVNTLNRAGPWQNQFRADVYDIDEIAHAILDLLIQSAQSQAQNTSPSTPSSPAPHVRLPHMSGQGPGVPVPYNADQLMRLKIVMRESEHAPQRPKESSVPPEDVYKDEDRAAFGRNDGTVRFLFGPPRVVGEGI